MIEIVNVGDGFTVTPVTIKVSGVDMVAYIGTDGSTKWLNALYVNNVSISTTESIFWVINNEVSSGKLSK